MKDINVVTLKGRFGKDPEAKKTANNKVVVYFRLANNRDWGQEENQKHTNWIQCRAYGNLAEKVIMPYCKSGTSVIVSGELRVDSWQDEHGAYQTLTYVLVTDLNFAGSSQSQNNSNKVAPTPQPQFTPNSYQEPVQVQSTPEYMPYDGFDDSIF